MGEYATHKGKEIKIGTCEQMYYIRFEDRFAVEKLENSLDCSNTLNLNWRIPVPKEDGIAPGHYDSYICDVRIDNNGLELCENKGTVQLHNDFGLLINVDCGHGISLPKETDQIKAFWNGKREHIVLSAMKNTLNDIRMVITCRACGSAWNCDFEDIESRIYDTEIRDRLKKIVMDYRERRGFKKPEGETK